MDSKSPRRNHVSCGLRRRCLGEADGTSALGAHPHIDELAKNGDRG
jgi:hypothetical protein